jgi:methylase of polypeptide subunit release factors
MRDSDSINARILRAFFQWGRRPAMSSKLVTRMIFDVDPTLRKHKARAEFYWDLTTLTLKKALLAHVRDGQRVLEIGTGEYGILAVFLAKKRKIDLTAVEIVPEFINTSREIAQNNHVDIRIILSDMFENVGGLFDVVYWNLPYVPMDFGTKFYKIADKNLAIGLEGWHGGPTGLELFDSFLKVSPKALSGQGKIIAGINTYFAPEPRIKETIEKYGLTLSSVCGCTFNPSKAFIITKRPSTAPELAGIFEE